MFYRRPEQVALTFAMPTVICLLLGSIFSTKLANSDVSTGTVIAASMLAYGILSTSFINLGISIAADRETGALRRLHGTPATASSYFIGKIMLVAIVSLAEAVLLLGVGASPRPFSRMVQLSVCSSCRALMCRSWSCRRGCCWWDRSFP
jgi:ABC-2 type transport system permease protein